MRSVTAFLVAPLLSGSFGFTPCYEQFHDHVPCTPTAQSFSWQKTLTPAPSWSGRPRSPQGCFMSANDDIPSRTAMKSTVPSSSSSTTATATSSITTLSSSSSSTILAPKEAVKLFGRLAEKYIILQEEGGSGGMCCYSACSDCEFRLPDGGYRMADQSATRPKWIPSYTTRNRVAAKMNNNNDNTTTPSMISSKWSAELFLDEEIALSKEDFVERLRHLSYAPPLGGPYLGESAAAIEDTTAAERLFDLLAVVSSDDKNENRGSSNGKQVLTKHQMSLRLGELAGGEVGLTWAGFSKALLDEA